MFLTLYPVAGCSIATLITGNKCVVTQLFGATSKTPAGGFTSSSSVFASASSQADLVLLFGCGAIIVFLWVSQTFKPSKLLTIIPHW